MSLMHISLDHNSIATSLPGTRSIVSATISTHSSSSKRKATWHLMAALHPSPKSHGSVRFTISVSRCYRTASSYYSGSSVISPHKISPHFSNSPKALAKVYSKFFWKLSRPLHMPRPKPYLTTLSFSAS